MLFYLWLVVWAITFFCCLPLCSTKIAREYGRMFNVKIYSKVWKGTFFIGFIVTIILSIIIIFC